MRPGATNGFTMEEYAEYTNLVDLHKHYSSMVITDMFDDVTFKKAISDTLRRWDFITRWAARDSSRNVSVLKKRIESKRIVELMKFDEPLCFEDMICKKPSPRCGNCPLWHINGISCEDEGSIKFKLMKPWVDGKGYFYPHFFAAILRKLRYGNAIYDYDVEMLVGGR